MSSNSSFNPSSMKVSSGRDSNYKSSDVKSRPTSDPKSRKDFKKIMESDQEDEQQDLSAKEILEETDGIELATEGKKKQAPPSLFDLTSGKVSIDNNSKSTTLMESPSEIYSKLTAGNSKKGNEENLFEEDTRFATEQADLSYVNPLAATNTNQEPIVNLNISTEKATIPVNNLQEIINQMIDKINEIKQSGTTETLITLKQPPIFEGATIVVTAFDHAKNEFNISIENLTQAGKQLMDQQANKDSLLLGLEQKGYGVHIFTTTTLVEHRLADVLPQQEESNGQDQEEKDEKQKRQNQS